MVKSAVNSEVPGAGTDTSKHSTLGRVAMRHYIYHLHWSSCVLHKKRTYTQVQLDLHKSHNNLGRNIFLFEVLTAAVCTHSYF